MQRAQDRDQHSGRGFPGPDQHPAETCCLENQKCDVGVHSPVAPSPGHATASPSKPVVRQGGRTLTCKLFRRGLTLWGFHRMDLFQSIIIIMTGDDEELRISLSGGWELTSQERWLWFGDSLGWLAAGKAVKGEQAASYLTNEWQQPGLLGSVGAVAGKSHLFFW